MNDSEIEAILTPSNHIEPEQQSKLGETRAPVPTLYKLASEPDLLKQLVRMIFERELGRMQALAAGQGTIPGPCEDEVIELPLRTFLGKHYPGLKSQFRWKVARVTRRSHLLALRIQTMQALYRLLFKQAMEQEDLSPEEAMHLDEKELRHRLGAAFCRNLQLLQNSSKARAGTIDQLDRALAWFDRGIQAWLDWCVSLLPYHAPALGEQDPQAILVKFSRR